MNKQMMTKIVILGLAITGCAVNKPSSEVIEIAKWTNPNASECELTLSSEIKSLPFDIAINVQRSNLEKRYDVLNSHRPWVIRTDLQTKEFGSNLIPKEQQGQAYFSIANWNPNKDAVLTNYTWEEPQHAMLETATHNIIMDSRYYRSDVLNIELDTNNVKNLTEYSPSYYNAGATPYNGKLLFTALMDGIGRTYSMNLDGSDKAPFNSTAGYSYGNSVSPDNTKYAFHAEYKVYIGDMITKQEIQVQTPCEFNFGPKWSPDSQNIVFKCGPNNETPDLYIADRDGNNVRLLASLNGYNSSVPFMDGYDYHGGGSDRIEWNTDSQGVIHGKKIGPSIELVLSKLDGTQVRLTNTQNTHNSYPAVSKDGLMVLFSSKVSQGPMNLIVMNLSTLVTTQVTDMDMGCNARMGFWR